MNLRKTRAAVKLLLMVHDVDTLGKARERVAVLFGLNGFFGRTLHAMSRTFLRQGDQLDSHDHMIRLYCCTLQFESPSYLFHSGSQALSLCPATADSLK